MKYIPSFDTEFIVNSNNPVDPFTQLSYVLPKNSLYLLPKTLENSLLEHFKSHYESELSIDWSFCRYLWEAHINVSHINIEDIESENPKQ